MIFVGYQAAGRTCSGCAQPGAVALMSWFLGAYPAPKGRNDGIYNCRNQRGSAAPSVHGEGRAVDLGCSIGDRWAQQLADTLVAHSRELGIQCVIFAHRIWSGAHPNDGWRPYYGLDQHTTHLHVELSWAAAAHLTTARVRAVLNPTRPSKRLPVLTRYLHEGNSGTAVMNLQKRLTALGYKPGAADGKFGPATGAALRAFQRKRKLTADGWVGKDTAPALGWTWRGPGA